MTRTAGTILLSLGFAMLTTAVLLRDPTALDANIGAGILSLIGIPVGTLGLLLTIASAVYTTRRRRDQASPA